MQFDTGYKLQKRQTGSAFQIFNSWMESWPGLTVIPPSEICELFWAIFAFTTPFSSWNTWFYNWPIHWRAFFRSVKTIKPSVNKSPTFSVKEYSYSWHQIHSQGTYNLAAFRCWGKQRRLFQDRKSVKWNWNGQRNLLPLISCLKASEILILNRWNGRLIPLPSLAKCKLWEARTGL